MVAKRLARLLIKVAMFLDEEGVTEWISAEVGRHLGRAIYTAREQQRPGSPAVATLAALLSMGDSQRDVGREDVGALQPRAGARDRSGDVGQDR